MCEKCGCKDFIVDGQTPAYQCLNCKHIIFLDKEINEERGDYE